MARTRRSSRGGLGALIRTHTAAEIIDAGDARPGIERDRAAWRLEPLFDGLRVLILRLDDDIAIRAPDRDWSASFPAVQNALRTLPARTFVLDAEICALDETGRPDFARLRAWIASPRGAAPVVIAHDLLHLDGDDLRPRPLADRASRLAALAGTSLLVSTALDGPLDTVLTSVARLGLPGVLARRPADPYPDPASPTWLSVPASPPPAARSPSPATRSPSPGSRSPSPPPSPASRSLSPPPTLTNPTKVLFPRDGHTKSDIAAYYRAIAPVLLPHLRDRPVVGQRWPDGIDDFTWYQHRVPPRAPDYIRPVMITGIRRIVVDSEDGLLWLVNTAALTLHGFAARTSSQDAPDWLCLDLDPGPSTPWTDTIAIAHAVRDRLERDGLASVPKTSGQSGLHVMVPLAPGHRHQDAAAYAEAVARDVARVHPDRISLDMAKGRRGGRLLLEHRQGAGKLLVMPYSLRARDGAPVSTPLTWSEVTPALDPRAFNLRSLRARLDAHGDLAAPLLAGTARVDAARLSPPAPPSPPAPGRPRAPGRR